MNTLLEAIFVHFSRSYRLRPIRGVLAWVFLFTFGAIALPAFAGQNVATRLVADTSAVESGRPFRLGVRFSIPPHAHIYWKFPGTSGLATGIDWKLPEGFEIGELQWPVPSRFEIKEIDDITYGYEGEVVLFADVMPPLGLRPGESVRITAEPYWLICLESGQCIPEGERLELELHVGVGELSEGASLIDRFAERVPVPLDSSIPMTIVTADAAAGNLRLQASGTWEFLINAANAPPRFYALEGDAWELHTAPEAMRGPSVALVFRCEGEKPGEVAGAALVPMLDRKTGERTTFYVRLGEE